jgi:PAS domain S-box-containing protein
MEPSRQKPAEKRGEKESASNKDDKIKKLQAENRRLRAELKRTREGNPPASGAVLDGAERKQAEDALAKSEKRFRALIENSLDQISLLDRQGALLWESPSAINILGYETGKFINQDIFQLMHPDDLEWTRKLFIQLIQNPGWQQFGSFRLRHNDGSWCWVEAIATNLLNEPGIEAIVLNYRDITERKRAEDMLRESEEKFQAIANYTVDWESWFGPDGKYLWVNPGVEQITGYSAEEILAMPDFISTVIADEDRPTFIERFQKAIRGNRGENFEFRYLHKNGAKRWLSASWQPINDAQGNPLGTRSSGRDITDRKQAEQTLRETESLLRTVLSNAPITIFATDSRGVFTLSEGKGLERVGLKPDENVGVSALDMYGQLPFVEETGEVIPGKDVIRRALAGETLTVFNELRGVYFDNRISPIRDAGGMVVGIVGIATDVTERKRVEGALRESEEKFRTLADQSPNMIFINKRGRVIYANIKCEELMGYRREEFYAPDFDFFNLIAPESMTIIRNSFTEHQKGNEFQPYEYTLITKDGKRLEAINASKLIRYENEDAILGVVTDITERKRAEEEIHQLNVELEKRVEDRTRELRDAQEQLVRHEKLAVLGQMASSVGHELRNPLGVISSAVYYLKLIQPDADDKMKQYLGIIEQETRASEKIITDLLDFARIKSVDREPVPVSELIRQALERFPAPPSVEVALDLPADLPRVYADPRQMTQVLGNLILNACQAMLSPSSTTGVAQGGHLTISASAKDEVVAIAVKDTGLGIPPENISKLFEPLFTTKPKGIGLGLAVSKKLIEANEGRIEVQSEAGKGSTFTLILPVKQ